MHLTDGLYDLVAAATVAVESRGGGRVRQRASSAAASGDVPVQSLVGLVAATAGPRRASSLQHAGTHGLFVEPRVVAAAAEPVGRRDRHDTSRQTQAVHPHELCDPREHPHSHPQPSNAVRSNVREQSVVEQQLDPEQSDLQFEHITERSTREQYRQLRTLPAQFLPGVDGEHADLHPELAELRGAAALCATAGLRFSAAAAAATTSATIALAKPRQAELQDRTVVREPPVDPSQHDQHGSADQTEPQHGHCPTQRDEARDRSLRGSAVSSRAESRIQSAAATSSDHSGAADVAQVEDRNWQEDLLQSAGPTRTR